MRSIALPTLLLILLAACGRTGGPGLVRAVPAGPGTFTASLPRIEVFNVNDVFPGVAVNGAYVGDTDNDLPWRTVFRFDVGGIPTGAVVQSAVFRTHRAWDYYGNPHSTLGDLLVTDVEAEVNTALVTNWFVGTILAAGFAELVPPNAFAVDQPVPYGCDVTARVQAAVNAGRSRLNLRVHWQAGTDGNGRADGFYFEAAGPSTLEITYGAP